MTMYHQPPAILERVDLEQSTIDGWGLETVPLGDLSLNRYATTMTAAALSLSNDAKARHQAGFYWRGSTPTATDDYNGTSWVPQGLTSSGDADGATGTIDGDVWLFASWHNNNTRIRISAMNWSQFQADSTVPCYRHILLVEPYVHPTLGASFKNIPIHAGGMVAFNHWLYVADTEGGIRVFDMDQIKQVTGQGDTSKIGKQSNGTFHAQDYLYVLPQVALYEPLAPFGMRFSFLGLDQSPGLEPRLVVGEWSTDTSSAQPSWFRTWTLSSTTGELVPNAVGAYPAADEWQVSTPGLQGVNVYRDLNGDTVVLATSTTGDKLIKSVVDDTVETWWPWMNTNPEGLTYFPLNDWLWTLGEIGPRGVFAVLRSSL